MKSNANSESRPRASAVRRQGDGVASINMPSMVSLGIIQRPSQWMSPLLALFGHRGMSDLSPLSAQKRTSFIPNCCRHLGVADAGVSSSKVNLHLAKLNFRSMAFIGLTLSSGCGAEAQAIAKRRRGRRRPLPCGWYQFCRWQLPEIGKSDVRDACGRSLSCFAGRSRGLCRRNRYRQQPKQHHLSELHDPRPDWHC